LVDSLLRYKRPLPIQFQETKQKNYGSAALLCSMCGPSLEYSMKNKRWSVPMS
jgi:hypothetical protein